MNIDLMFWMTASQISEKYGVTTQAVRKASSRKRIHAIKVGYQWMINVESWEDYRRKIK